jgi:hypothetical protein
LAVSKTEEAFRWERLLQAACVGVAEERSGTRPLRVSPFVVRVEKSQRGDKRMVRKIVSPCFKAIGGRYFRAWRWNRFVARQARRIASKSRNGSKVGVVVLVQILRQGVAPLAAGFHCELDAQTRAIVGGFSMSEGHPENLYNLAVLSYNESGHGAVTVCVSGVSRSAAEALFFSAVEEWADGPSEMFFWWRQTISAASMG